MRDFSRWLGACDGRCPQWPPTERPTTPQGNRSIKKCSLSRGLISHCFFLAATIGLQAAVYSPRVLSPHNADTYSLRTFAQFERWRDLRGDAKVFEIFKYLVDTRTGLYPLGVPAREGNETLSEYGAVTDPIKMLNVYPIGHCGTLGPTAAAIMEGIGMGPARTLIIPGWNHVAAEVSYDGRWHYVDLDVRAVFQRPDGALASVEDARTDATLWKKLNSPLFFPLDPLDSVRDAYLKAPVQHRYGVASGGHTMDFVLRQGETFTRWWKPQGGRWNQHPSYAAKPFPRGTIERPPKGPKSKHPSFTVHSHGNGRFVYEPNLTARTGDFADGVYDSENVAPGETGLTLKSAGHGYAIFEVHSPYVIVPLVGELDDAADDREASIVQLDATGADLSISLDNGSAWQPLPAAASPVDLTPQVAGRYGYLLKIDLHGDVDKALVRSLKITTWVQVHPASLPSLRQGKNAMRLITGDHYGLPTRVMAFEPRSADRNDFLKGLNSPPKDYDPARNTSRVRGTIVAKVQAPPGARISWFSAGASFVANVGATGNTRNEISYGLGAPRDFVEIYRAAIPADQSHWHYNADREVMLAEPAGAIFVRYTGDPALNNIRIYAHCLDNHRRPAGRLAVTHAWRENGVIKTKQLDVEAGAAYVVEAGAEPDNEYLEMVCRGG